MTRNILVKWPKWKGFHFQVLHFCVVVQRHFKLGSTKVEPCAHILKHYKRPIFQSRSDLLITLGDTLVRSFALCPHTKVANFLGFVDPPPPSPLHIIVLVLMLLFNHTDEFLHVSRCSAARPAKPQWLNITYVSIFFPPQPTVFTGHAWIFCSYARTVLIFSHIADWGIACLAVYHKKKQATRTSKTGCGA